MKKIFVLILFFVSISSIGAKEIEVKFSNCVDGDTAKFIYKGEEITARFLAIDTPETVHPTKGEEKYGKEASEYTCRKLKEANKITLEFDNDSDEKDKYNRYLVWVFVDGNLLQEKLISKGLASVAYLYGDYKYTNKLEMAEQLAEENKLGIWNIDLNEQTEEAEKDNKDIKEKDTNKINSFIEKYKDYIVLIGALIIIYIFNLKPNKKIENRLKKKLKNDIKKRLK
jgi:micrococcal nuclease